MPIIYPDKNTFQKQYEELSILWNIIARELVVRITALVSNLPSHPSVKSRIKDFNSYYKKYLRRLKANPVSSETATPEELFVFSKDSDLSLGDPSRLIFDIIGLRVVCPFLEDIFTVEDLISRHFEVVEVQHKGGDHTFREFGYESIHLLIKIPDDIIRLSDARNCKTAEIQIRTILQDAWAEVEHELVYKAEFTPFDNPMKRKLAAVNASLSLADIIFQEIRSYQRQLNGELEKRRDSFFKKIEETTDALLFSDFTPAELDEAPPLRFSSNESIDELLLNALYAHNKSKFNEAIGFYTQILGLNPEPEIRSLILKHRGMAYFARSHYVEAVADFAESLELDPESYKSAYYQGIVYSVLKKYREAIGVFDRALEINPYQPFCLYRRGQAYFHLEDYPKALADCEAALALESFEGAKKFRQLVLDTLKM